MNSRVQGFDAAAKHLLELCYVRNILHWQAGIAKKLCSAAASNQLQAVLVEARCKLDNAPLVVDTNYRYRCAQLAEIWVSKITTTTTNTSCALILTQLLLLFRRHLVCLFVCLLVLCWMSIVCSANSRLVVSILTLPTLDSPAVGLQSLLAKQCSCEEPSRALIAIGLAKQIHLTDIGGRRSRSGASSRVGCNKQTQRLCCLTHHGRDPVSTATYRSRRMTTAGLAGRLVQQQQARCCFRLCLLCIAWFRHRSAGQKTR